jgi:predicted transcriptional regulator
MTGSGLGLTARDRQLLEHVQRFGVLTRDQCIALGLFSSKTRAKERLKRLVDAGYLAARPQPLPAGGPRLVYSTVGGTDAATSNRKRLRAASDLFLSHELGLVDIHIGFHAQTTIVRWLLARELERLNLGVIPDAYTEYEVANLLYCGFIEYDRGTETVGRFERKVRAYIEMARTERFHQVFSRKFFRVLVVTDGVRRLTSLSPATARYTDKIFRFTTLPELLRTGPLSNIWRRPGCTTPEALVNAMNRHGAGTPKEVQSPEPSNGSG